MSRVFSLLFFFLSYYMCMETELVFIEPIGNVEENYVYRFLFSDTPDVVWGNNFNITPAGANAGLAPAGDTISKEYRIVTNIFLDTAVKSTWFSMQDCIDGIIPLAFSTDEDNSIVLPFGISLTKTLEILTKFQIFYQEVKYKEPKSEENE